MTKKIVNSRFLLNNKNKKEVLMKLKYILNIYESLDNFPTKEDIMYDVQKENFYGTFSLKQLYKLSKNYPKKIEFEKFNTLINELIDDSVIKQLSDSKYIFVSDKIEV